MSLKVIVIDDEECIRDSIDWFLTDLGYKVFAVSEPSACDVYRGHNCKRHFPCADVLIIDHDMSRVSGIQFIEKMLDQGCERMLPNILVTSGNIDQVNLEKAVDLGCTVAQKPVSLNFIKKWLEHLPILLSSDS